MHAHIDSVIDVIDASHQPVAQVKVHIGGALRFGQIKASAAPPCRPPPRQRRGSAPGVRQAPRNSAVPLTPPRPPYAFVLLERAEGDEHITPQHLGKPPGIVDEGAAHISMVKMFTICFTSTYEVRRPSPSAVLGRASITWTSWPPSRWRCLRSSRCMECRASRPVGRRSSHMARTPRTATVECDLDRPLEADSLTSYAREQWHGQYGL